MEEAVEGQQTLQQHQPQPPQQQAPAAAAGGHSGGCVATQDAEQGGDRPCCPTQGGIRGPEVAGVSTSGSGCGVGGNRPRQQEEADAAAGTVECASPVCYAGQFTDYTGVSTR